MEKLTSKILFGGAPNIEFGKRVGRESCSAAFRWLFVDVEAVVLDTPLLTKEAVLQRPLTWTAQEKSNYILAYMHKKGNLRVVYYRDRHYDSNHNESSIMHIIDGKQRLNALMDFINCKQYVEIGDQKYYWTDLSEDLKDSFLKTQVFFSGIVSEYNYCSELSEKPNYVYSPNTDPKYYEVSDNALIAWYLDINSLNMPTHREHIQKLKALLQK